METIKIRKEAKVKLTKGQNVNLTKDGSKTSEALGYAFVGANWSAIERRWGAPINVDLDSSILMYDKDKNLIDVVYFGHLTSKDGSVRHSGDDREGDKGGDDGLDNEVISVNLKGLNPKVEYMVSVLNNYTHQKFSEIPNIELRIYSNSSGRKNDVDEVLCSYKLDNNSEYSGSEAIILGHFYRHNGLWKFSADGVGTKERSIEEISKNSALKVLY